MRPRGSGPPTKGRLRRRRARDKRADLAAGKAAPGFHPRAASRVPANPAKRRKATATARAASAALLPRCRSAPSGGKARSGAGRRGALPTAGEVVNPGDEHTYSFQQSLARGGHARSQQNLGCRRLRPQRNEPQSRGKAQAGAAGGEEAQDQALNTRAAMRGLCSLRVERGASPSPPRSSALP